MPPRRRSFAVLLAALALVVCRYAPAADANWAAPFGGNFTDPNNWSPAAPGSGDNAVFGLPFGTTSVYTVNFPGTKRRHRRPHHS